MMPEVVYRFSDEERFHYVSENKCPLHHCNGHLQDPDQKIYQCSHNHCSLKWRHYVAGFIDVLPQYHYIYDSNTWYILSRPYYIPSSMMSFYNKNLLNIVNESVNKKICAILLQAPVYLQQYCFIKFRDILVPASNEKTLETLFLRNDTDFSSVIYIMKKDDSELLSLEESAETHNNINLILADYILSTFPDESVWNF